MDQRQVGDESLPRRTCLVYGGALLSGMVSLAGCTDDVGEELPANEHWPGASLVPDLPVRERTEIVAEGIEEFADTEVADVAEFEAQLQERNIRFESAEEVVELLHLEYVEEDPERRGMLAVAGLVAGAFASLVAGGFDGQGLELVVFAADGSTIGIIEVSTEWATKFDRGTLSAAEYGELVASTIESRRTPPEHDVAPDE